MGTTQSTQTTPEIMGAYSEGKSDPTSSMSGLKKEMVLSEPAMISNHLGDTDDDSVESSDDDDDSDDEMEDGTETIRDESL